MQRKVSSGDQIGTKEDAARARVCDRDADKDNGHVVHTVARE